MSQNRLKRLLLLGIALVLLASCGGKKVAVNPPARPAGGTSPAGRTPTGTGAGPERPVTPAFHPVPATTSIVETVLTQLGVPYQWGGESPEEGFDCSGLVHWTFSQIGISLPRSTAEQLEAGEEVRRQDLQPGDLLFYAWGADPRQVTHVGVYVGDGEYVHSPGAGRNVLRAAAFDAANRKHFVTARRIPLPEPEVATRTQAVSETFSYVVEAGDYIWALARRFKVSPKVLLELNGLRMDDILKIGQQLLIPNR